MMMRSEKEGGRVVRRIEKRVMETIKVLHYDYKIFRKYFIFKGEVI
jgi:hypothetical protein